MTSRPIASAHAALPLHETVRLLLLSAQSQVRQSVNTAMVQTYWKIGRLIVEDEQGGEKRAAYGQRVLADLGAKLSAEFGAGFSHTNLKLFRQFYLSFPNSHTVCDQSGFGRLSWSHFRALIRIDNELVRDWYAREAAEQGWSARALDRPIVILFFRGVGHGLYAQCIPRTRSGRGYGRPTISGTPVCGGRPYPLPRSARQQL
jgi:hypothetical protein